MRRLAPVALLAALVGALLPAAAAGAAPAAPDRPVSWLAAGDSYSSGEGISGAGVDGDPHTCARSALAYGPKAADILTTQRGWQISPLVFPACTGATLDEFYNRGAGQHDPQWSQALAGRPPGNRFDVISLSFGGNDIGFKPILEGCFLSWGKSLSWTGMVARGASCDVDLPEIKKRVDALIAGRAPNDLHYGPNPEDLSAAEFYARLVSQGVSDSGTLVVVGYPRLFADIGNWGDWRGQSCEVIDRVDADMLNQAADYLNTRIQDAVAEANDALGAKRVRYVDRAALFAGHELCSGSVEYLNGISVTERIEHSFHPNDIGHQVTAEQVAGTVSDALAHSLPAPTTSAPPVAQASQAPAHVSAPAATSSPAPIGDGTSHFDIGDEFSSQCYVAWPTAPTYTSRAIVMTMSCASAPRQFLFVRVTYPDPNLPITPSTGNVRVHGRITDYATSTYGYQSLIVDADSVTW